MCGIFGFAGPASVADSIDLGRVAASLRHRGPDASGSFRASHGDVGCAFAHTRLAIIDLSVAGRQPMTTADGRYTIVFNGEVYNFRELRCELERAGVPFVSQTDSEVVLQAYAAWGPRCVTRFRGIFAFAIWDTANRRLFVARDHLGVKPLYYAETKRGLAFASEVRSLLGAALVDRTMSVAGLASYLTYGSVEDPLTIVDGVRALLPGHTATFENGRLSVERYWRLERAADSKVTFGEAVERVRPLLQESVSMQLVADVPIGVFLSGGVDSSAIVALASASSAKPVHTFTVTFDEAAYSEEKQASEIAQRFGCEHHTVHLAADRAVLEFDDYVDALDQPSADGVNTYFVSKAAREAGLSVALSGTGGDEVFAGYPNFRNFGRFLSFGRAARPIAPLLSALLGSSIKARKLAAIASAGGDPSRTYAALRSMFTPAQVRDLIHAVPVTKNGVQADASDPAGLYSELELTHYLRNTLLRDADVMSMAHSLEVRVPLLDPELVTCVASIPGALKLSRATNKPLLVAACGTLPAGIGRRPKMGFTLPMDVWFRGVLRDRLTKVFSRSRAIDARPLWQAFLNGSKRVSWSRIWTVAALLDWSERNDVPVPA
ncbi:MAG TPA: asparagine synthase (glutamine-hydrolyzing) [Thermoanaerobaculia bacterium]|nr:asparagine synthase (glutamine-hydrolyzing) [Thermoanaerobaculia bacterium]